MDQVGILSWGKDCADPRFPDVFTRISDVVDWVKGTVCARTGELCLKSKSGKNSKTKKMYDKCVKLPTFAPWPTYSPTITAQPYSQFPFYVSTNWPTWMPTASKFHLQHNNSIEDDTEC